MGTGLAAAVMDDENEDCGKLAENPDGAVPIPVRNIYAGQSVNFALCWNGNVYVWGVGEMGLMGLGDMEDYYTPTQLQFSSELLANTPPPSAPPSTVQVARNREQQPTPVSLPLAVHGKMRVSMMAVGAVHALAVAGGSGN